MRPIATVLLFALTATTYGCSSLQQQLGDIEKKALVDSVERDIDTKLAQHGLSLSLIESAVDTDGDGKITPAEVKSFVKETTKDYLALEAKKLVDVKVNDAETRLVSKHETGLSSLWTKFEIWLGGLVSVYLGKQVVSRRLDDKKHKSHDSRMKVLEALVGKPADSGPKA